MASWCGRLGFWGLQGAPIAHFCGAQVQLLFAARGLLHAGGLPVELAVSHLLPALLERSGRARANDT